MNIIGKFPVVEVLSNGRRWVVCSGIPLVELRFMAYRVAQCEGSITLSLSCVVIQLLLVHAGVGSLTLGCALRDELREAVADDGGKFGASRPTLVSKLVTLFSIL